MKTDMLLRTMKKSDFVFILSSFLIWRIVLFIFLFIAIKFVPLQQNFLGGGLENYLKDPYLWSWLNFDGEHYLSLARIGYQPLTYFYFPVFPLLIRFVADILVEAQKVFSGLIVSNISFLLALIGLWKLVLLDFKKVVAKMTIILMLLFPTSFYFGSYYTESTFLALTIWSFYLVRTNKWFSSGFLASIATVTRVIGVALFPALMVEYWGEKKKSFKKLLSIVLVPLGIVLYMAYLKIKTGDPFEFLNSVSIFGDQRSSQFILLPQVFYRYIVKIIPNLTYSYFPVVFTTFLEIFVAIAFLALLILGIKKVRWSYLVYALLSYIIPSLSGSFSSFPRYVLVIFPAFIVASIYLVKAPRLLQFLIFAILFIGLGFATAFFTRGIWIA